MLTEGRLAPSGSRPERGSVRCSAERSTPHLRWVQVSLPCRTRSFGCGRTLPQDDIKLVLEKTMGAGKFAYAGFQSIGILSD
jgi:hypothetical protein